MSFIEQVESVLAWKWDWNFSVTENSALGYRTTGRALLDLNFSTASLRNLPEDFICRLFAKAYREDRKSAVKWLFYARDVRGGLGERRLFRTIFPYLTTLDPELPFAGLIRLIPEYGRFDDLFCLFETSCRDIAIGCIGRQLREDCENRCRGAAVSLLAKWLPGVNSSSRKSRAMACMLADRLHLTGREYRKTLSSLREYLDVVERKMSADRYGEIRYEAVPSKAGLIYRNAFLRHDEERRRAFLESPAEGTTTINAGVLYPHEIVHAYSGEEYDETLERQWSALPDIVQGLENTIAVADGSGSMTARIGGGSCTALSVANALAVYFAERSTGPFLDRYITFSMNPRLVNLSCARSLREKLRIAIAHNEVANTDIYKVFQLILRTATQNGLEQSELPANVIVISDMEFDSCAVNAESRLFTQIGSEYAACGYRLPRLIFWNVASRTGTIPLLENDLGILLVSGFSPNIFRMVMSNRLDPYAALMDQLDQERYAPLETLMSA